MKCRQCGKEFEPNIPTQKFCSLECARKNVYARKKNGEPPPASEPFEFICKHCGKRVFNDGHNDRRMVFCSKRCHDLDHDQRRAQRKRRYRGNNRGLSGGMSLSSLIRLEKRSLD